MLKVNGREGKVLVLWEDNTKQWLRTKDVPSELVQKYYSIRDAKSSQKKK